MIPRDVLPDYPTSERGALEGVYSNLLDHGYAQTEIVDFLVQRLNHRGWFKTDLGWERLGPNVSDKVNVRHAMKQPNGRYLVRDVVCFYPNAVKGADDRRFYSEERIKLAIDNTNRAIGAGGQRPALALEHPNEYQKMAGVPAKGFGSAVNWRYSGDMARCDLVDVDPVVVQEWKKRKFTGLSAGLVTDADSLNIRFGHVALLGVESQALAALPTTEVFKTNDTLFFSAEPYTGDSIMSVTADQKKLYCAMKERFGALQTAFACAEAGEPGANKKIEEAFAAYKTARTEFKGDTFEHEDEDEDEKLIKEMMKDEHAAEDADEEDEEEKDEKKYDADKSQEAHEKSRLPEGSKVDGDKDTMDDGLEVGVKQFNALRAKVQEQDELIRSQGSLINKSKNIINALLAKQMRGEFSTFAQNLLDKGHRFSLTHAMKMFDSCNGNTDQIKTVKDFLENAPSDPNLADMGATFGADGDKEKHDKRTKLAGDMDSNTLLQTIRRAIPGVTFSAEDMKLAEAISKVNPVGN